MSIIGDTTLVTEHRLYRVNRNGRKSLTKAAVSARSANVVEEQFTVTQTEPHVIKKHANKHLTIKSEHPIRAVFRQGIPELEATPIQPAPPYRTAKLNVRDITLNARNVVEVEDDVAVTQVDVHVLNVRTGETEIVTCVRTGAKFMGHYNVDYGQAAGTNFDECLRADYDDELVFQYLDGRNIDSVPETITVVKRIESAPLLPTLYVRSHVTLNDTIGIAVRNAASTYVTVDCERLGFTRTILLRPNGSIHEALLATNSILGAQEGDVIRVTTTATDIHNVTHTVTSNSSISHSEIVEIEAIAELNTASSIRLRDPNLTGHTVGVLIEREGDFVRVRLNRLAPYTGIYEGSWTPSEPGTYTLRYVAAGNAVHDHVIVVAEQDTEVKPELPECPPQIEVPIYGQNQVEMEINGLFTLNGRFSGAVYLYAVEDEMVRCSVVHSS